MSALDVHFPCSGCGATLAARDGDVRKQAICPACGERTWIVPGFDELRALGIVPAAVLPGEMLRRSWRGYMSAPVRCLSAVAIVYLASIVIVSAAIATAVYVFSLAHEVPGITADPPRGLSRTDAVVLWSADHGDEVLALLGYIGTALVPALLLVVWLEIGLLRLMLQLARGRSASLRLLASGGASLGGVLVAGGIYVALVLLGLLACVVPGVIWATMYWPAVLLVVDRRLGPLRALRLARQITTGHKVELFVVLLIAMGLSTLAGLIPLGLGHLLVDPLLLLVAVHAYLQLTGQS